MRSQTLPALVLLAATGGLLTGCGFGGLNSYAEPGATTAASKTEIPGRHSPNPLTAQRFIDHIRMGHGLDAEGQVPRDFAASAFLTGEAIHVSMEVADAPAGSIVRVVVHDAATNCETWVQEKRVEPGRSYLSFTIDTELVPATYRADVIIGDETVVGREFQIVEPKA